MPQITVSNLTFAYDSSFDNVFENLNLQLDTSWRLGLTGRNGRGKTTLLKLLAGEYGHSGTITSPVSFGYFPYEPQNPQDASMRVLELLCPGTPEWELLRELSLLEVDESVLERPFCSLSNGERTKLLLAALFMSENRFLLIDEPTNHLDMHGRQLVGKYLRSKSGFILVSHDRALLDSCTDHIMAINRTGIEVQRGNLSSWMLNKERRDRFESAQNEKLKKGIGHLSDAARRTGAWSDKIESTKYGTRNSGLRPDRGYIGHKAVKMMKRSKAIEGRRQAAIEEKSSLMKDIEYAESLKITPLQYRSKRLVSLGEVAVLYDGRAVCPKTSFEIEQGDRIALCGRNGSGKSSLLRLILGEELSFTGRLLRSAGLQISYVAQDASFLQGSLSGYARESGIDESLFKAILRKLDFSRTQLEKDMQELSAGQKKKALIARSLCERAHLLIWDEPLNYIDLYSRIQLEELLLEYKPTLIFVEHDSIFCEKIATEKVQL